MQIYAILDKDTNVVKNVIIAEDENFIFCSPDEYFVLGNKAVDIGMLYDTSTNSFPEIGDRGDLLNLRDKIKILIDEENEILTKNIFEEDRQSHQDYLNKLKTILEVETYSSTKKQFNNLTKPTEPRELKEVTEEHFRSLLTLSEKILWDNPETGTIEQKVVINTIKSDFPFSDAANMTEEIDLLEKVGIIGKGRSVDIFSKL